MEKLTKREALEKMRDMWLWIAEGTERKSCLVTKVEYFNEVIKNKAEIPKSGCYACEYAFLECFEYFEGSIDDRELNDEMCNFCPVNEWAECPSGCTSMCSPYYKWIALRKENWQEAAKYAREIAALAQDELEKMR